ncbi:MAG: recombinase family protein [Syntrophobacteraceae bacterium]|jgi:DNA invertase Pin-like site-specific DNA recombinase
MESKVPFICADMPEMNELCIHVVAAVAEYESKLVSKRTKEALAAAKRRGVKLGKVDNLSKGNKDRAKQAQDFSGKMRDLLEPLVKDNL